MSYPVVTRIFPCSGSPPSWGLSRQIISAEIYQL
jgi:hypothetical protein